MEEVERIQNLLGFHYFLHERIFQRATQGYILKEKLLLVLRQHHNIPKDECPIIIRGLEILGLIKEEDKFYKVEKPEKSREEIILSFKKKLNLV